MVEAARSITTGFWHSCAITGGRGLSCWRRNDLNQLGDGTSSNRTAPTVVPVCP